MSGTKHVAHFVMMNPNKRGPVELLFPVLAREWASRGGRTSCWFSAAPPAWYAEMLDEAGVEHGVIEGVTDEVIDKDAWNAAVERAALRLRPDVVHVHHGWHGSAATLEQHGIGTVQTEHSGRFPQRLELLRRVVRHRGQRSVRRFIAVADFINVQTQRDFMVPASKVVTVHNGVDTEHFRPRPDDRARLRHDLLGIDDDRPVIVQAAFLDARKRQAMLVGAMPAVLEVEPRAHLVLAGGGTDETMLRELVHSLGVGDHVSLLTGDNDVAALYAAADVATLVSTHEGLPGSAIEALSCGLPLLIAPNGGSVEVIEDEVSGLFLHDETVEGTTAALTRLVTDQALRERLSAAGLQRVRELFDIRVTARRTADVHDDVLAAG
ncbi:glycosyltransferase family 4 protein [Aeromicrobium endophyticum]|uniref:Glycosyltransferase family 1 protein n=1 Tax=Aeromicrobium endophyticum TaxID=2292704 RepID=A0A371P2P4_9ACTN|nr:glycosyltransferase family 4 protein [Aeromicrobium endophyticum]REK69868.1 glycosyltransferase family 1 protein [Aeromicrobium endophyticum]